MTPRDCEGCGAPLKARLWACEYCKRACSPEYQFEWSPIPRDVYGEAVKVEKPERRATGRYYDHDKMGWFDKGVFVPDVPSDRKMIRGAPANGYGGAP